MTKRNPNVAPPSNRSFAAERLRRTEAAEKKRAAARELIDDDVTASARAYVDHVWDEAGAGPTWLELCRDAGRIAEPPAGNLDELARLG